MTIDDQPIDDQPIDDQPIDNGVAITAILEARPGDTDRDARGGGRRGWRATVRLVVLSTLLGVGVPVAVSHAEPAGAPAGSGRGPAAVIEAGDVHSCALLENGTVKCWGYNGGGQLGQGDTEHRGDAAGEMGDNLAPVDVGSGRTSTSIAAGGSHTCVLLDDGSVKCWGYNGSGQLGLGDTEHRGDAAGEMGDKLPTVDLGSGRTATAITAGSSHTCVLLDDGTVKCWGYNGSGQLGLGDTENRGDAAGEMGDHLAAVDFGTGRTATAITTSNSHTCALLDNGTVRCWGFYGNGRLGYGDAENRGDGPGEMGDNLPPVDLGTGRTATAITAGGSHSCVLLDGGSIKCWGYNGSGELGLGDKTNRGDGAGEMGDDLAPVDLGTGRTATALTAGAYHTCAALDSGALKCWGGNGVGQLGLGDTEHRGDAVNEMGDFLPAINLGNGRSATAITAGTTHACALLDDNSVKCWGYGNLGQLGQGDKNDRGDAPNEMGDNLAAVLVDGSLRVIPVAVAPAPPSGVLAVAGPASAMLVWSAPADDGGRPVVGYRVQLSTDGVSWSTVVVDTGSVATSYTVGGLTEGVAVRFRVAAINTVGVSPPTLSTVPVFPTTATPASGDVVPLSPGRLLDTRGADSTVDGVGAGGGVAAAGSVTVVQVAGRGGVPADAVAAVLNVTVAGSAADGFATVFPCGQPVPTASNVNYRAGVDTANAVIVGLGDGGEACIYTYAATHLLADVNAHITTHITT